MGCCSTKKTSPAKAELIEKSQISPVIKLQSTINLGIHDVFDFSEVIGHGHFGNVRKARRLNEGGETCYAVKSIPKKNFISTQKTLKREFKIFNSVDHPNIVKLVEAFEDKLYLHLVMELCSGGTLIDRITSLSLYSEEEASEILIQVVNAVLYLHENNIVHRDLKPENLLFLSSDSNIVKICDFGTSIKSSRNGQLFSFVGTPYYIAPEVHINEYTKSCDVWSVGVIMYFMLIGKRPFLGNNIKEMLSKAINGFSGINENEYIHLSSQAKDLMKKMLNSNDKRRISIEQVLVHPWFRTGKKQTLIPEKVMKNLRDEKNNKKHWDRIFDMLVQELNIFEIRQIVEEFCARKTGKISIREFFLIIQGLNLRISSVDLVSEPGSESESDKPIEYDTLISHLNEVKELANEQVIWNAFASKNLNQNGEISLEDVSKIINESGFDIKSTSWPDKNLSHARSLNFKNFSKVIHDLSRKSSN